MDGDKTMHLASRVYMRDIYAMMLFQEERHANPLKSVDRPHNWQELTTEDRDVYRKLAGNLTVEAGRKL